jgi:hypothetical protein
VAQSACLFIIGRAARPVNGFRNRFHFDFETVSRDRRCFACGYQAYGQRKGNIRREALTGNRLD